MPFLAELTIFDTLFYKYAAPDGAPEDTFKDH